MNRLLAVAFAVLAASTLFARDLDCVDYTPLPAALALTPSPAAGINGTVARLDEQHVVIVAGSGLTIMDISDPATPLVVGSLSDLPDAAVKGRPAVVGHHLYLANAVTTIVDVDDPANPAVVGQLNINSTALGADGNLLAVATSTAGVTLFDAAVPLSPTVLSTPGSGSRVKVMDGILAIMGSGFDLYDISDPTTPTLSCSLEYPTEQGGGGYNAYLHTTYVYDLVIVGNRVLATTNEYSRYGDWVYGVDIHNSFSRRCIDITNPAAPVETAQFDTGSDQNWWPFVDFNLTTVGDLLADGRQLFDPLSDDLAPVAGLPAGEPRLGGVVDLGSGRILILDSHEITYTELADPPAANVADPFTVNSTESGAADAAAGDGFLVQLRNGVGYYGDPYCYLAMYDSIDAVEVSYFDIDDRFFTDLAVAGRRIAVGDHIYAVDDQLNLTGHDLDLGYFADQVEMSGPNRLALLADNVLHVVDVTDLSSPTEEGQCTLSSASTVHDMLWHDDLILVGSSEGLQLATVPTAGTPSYQGSLAFDGGIIWLAMADDETALALAGDQLVRIDVSNPFMPSVLSSAPAGLLAGRPLVKNGLAYAAHDGFVSLYDVDTLAPLGSILLSHGVKQVVEWQQSIAGVGSAFRQFVALPTACELTPTATEDLPQAGGLMQVAPNPFNPQTVLSFRLDQDGPATLSVYDLRGRCVRQLADGHHAAGSHQITWNGRDDAGRELAAGTYLLRLETSDSVDVGKVSLVK